MNKKGQLFSLDFLISLIAITAAVGLMIHSIETTTYNQKEFNQRNEMESVAELATAILAADSRIACTDGRGQAIVNCIDSGKNRSHALDFVTGSGYHYSLQDNSGTIDESSAVYTSQDFYEVKRTVFIDGTDSANEAELALKVWKWEKA